MPNAEQSVFVGMMDGAQLAADERGATLTMLGGDNDVTKQVGQIEDFISQGVDAIVVQAVDTTGIVTAIEEANEAGIPRIYNGRNANRRGTLSAPSALTATSPDTTEVHISAKCWRARAKLWNFKGVLGQETSREKSRGFAEAIAEHEGMEILSSQPADYDRPQPCLSWRIGSKLTMRSMLFMQQMMKWPWELCRQSRLQGSRMRFLLWETMGQTRRWKQLAQGHLGQPMELRLHPGIHCR